METGGIGRPGGTCLIAGCGYAGTRLARRLGSQGPVLALVRAQAAAAELTREGIPAQVFDFDGACPEAAPAMAQAAGAMVYLAPPPTAGREDPRLRRFLTFMDSAHPEVLLYLSTTGVYGNTGGAPVDEASPTVPGEDRSRRRLDAERQAGRWCAARGVRCVIFRVPAIYGPWRLPLDRLRLGEPVLRIEESGPGNRIHVDDLVEACLAALARPVAGVFNLTDGASESMTAFLKRVAALADLPQPPEVSWAEAQEAISPGMLSYLRESRLVIGERARTVLGLCLRYPDPGEGIRASLAEMGQ